MARRTRLRALPRSECASGLHDYPFQQLKLSRTLAVGQCVGNLEQGDSTRAGYVDRFGHGLSFGRVNCGKSRSCEQANRIGHLRPRELDRLKPSEHSVGIDRSQRTQNNKLVGTVQRVEAFPEGLDQPARSARDSSSGIGSASMRMARGAASFKRPISRVTFRSPGSISRPVKR